MWNSDDNHLLETDNESCGMQTTHNSPVNYRLPDCGAVANCLYISDPASNKYSITQRISAWALNEIRVPKAYFKIVGNLTPIASSVTTDLQKFTPQTRSYTTHYGQWNVYPL